MKQRQVLCDVMSKGGCPLRTGENLLYTSVSYLAVVIGLLVLPALAGASSVSLASGVAGMAGAVSFAAGAGPAQATGQSTGGTPPATANDIPVYLPGGEEAGPTLPTQRGIGPIRSGEALFQIAPYLGVNGVYDTGLAPLSTDTTGQFLSRSGGGVELTFGVTGSRAFRRSLLNLAYRGGYLHYPNNPYFSGMNHRGTVEVSHGFSRRLQLKSQNSFGYLSNSFFGNLGFAGYDRPNDTTPVDQFFNTPVLFLESTQLFTYQKSARMSFTGGGGGNLQWRQSSALAGMKGVNAIGNMAYRLTKQQTVGVTYSFNQFFFTNQYGGSNVHNVGLEYANKLTKTVSIGLAAGGARVESQSLRQVQVDPLIAALFGTSGGIEAVYSLKYLPTFSANLNYARKQWSANISGSRVVNPGNGLVLTNENTSANASIRYSARRWNAGVGANYSIMKGLKLDNGDFESYGANAGITFQVARGFSWTNDVSVRRFGGAGSVISNTFQNREQFRVTSGIYWSPSSFPLPLF